MWPTCGLRGGRGGCGRVDNWCMYPSPPPLQKCPYQVESSSIIPSDTRVDSYIAINRETFTCDLLLKTNNDTVIRGVVVFGEQIFEEESLFVYPR